MEAALRILTLYETEVAVLTSYNEIDKNRLAKNVSTDEIYPVRYSNLTSGFEQAALAGFRTQTIKFGDLVSSKYNCLVMGENAGCGSAREHAAVCLYDAGIRVIYAPSFNSVFRRNLINCGCIPTTHFDVIGEEIIAPDKIPDLSTHEKKIIKNGGLLTAFEPFTEVRNQPRSISKGQTLVEKILSKASKALCKAGDIVTVQPDLLFTYDVHIPLIIHALRGSTILHPNVLVFDDHFGGNPQYDAILGMLDNFAAKNPVKTYFIRDKVGGICHAVIMEQYAHPGQLIVGTDSHTATSGAKGALGLAVGATELTVAMKYGQLPISVPESIHISFHGKLSPDCAVKDIMLYLLGSNLVSHGHTRGRFLEFDVTGFDPTLENQLPVLCNMATEAGAWGGIAFSIDSNPENRPDKDAVYFREEIIDLSQIKPAVAMPHHPTNYSTLASISRPIRIQKVYIGSCTGGQLNDIEIVVQNLKKRNVNESVKLFIQPASYTIYEEACNNGYIDIITKAGAVVLSPGCGGCIGQHPAAIGANENGVWNTNRNFQGRTGSDQGNVFLSSTKTAVTAAINGYL